MPTSPHSACAVTRPAEKESKPARCSTARANVSNREQLVEALLEPSRTIAEGFASEVFVLADGTVVEGVVVSSTDGTTVVGTATGEKTLDDASVIERTASGVSAMPAMGSVLSRRAIRDVVEYLTTR